MARRASRWSLGDAWASLRADYDFAKSGRLRRSRPGVTSQGTSADYHFRSESEYLRMVELARDIAGRNDSVVGQVIDRAVANTVQGGIWPDPQTGDEGLDRELKARVVAEAEDPDACDLAGEHDALTQQHLALRQMLVDGDVVFVPTEDGPLQTFEGHRLRTPTTKQNVVLGVLLDDYGRRLQYWVSREDVGLGGAVRRVREIRAYDVRDEEGHRQVYHLYHPRRSSQTRGVTALAPMGALTEYFSDILFARLIQQQIVSCFAIFVERGSDFRLPGTEAQTGERSTETLPDGSTRTIEGYAPGMRIKGNVGEKLQGFAPRVPNPEFFPFAKLILQLIGVNVGMPLVLLLMDASETNFSGWRGAIEQAKMGFRSNQRTLITRFLRPRYLYDVRRWGADDPIIAAQAERSGVNLLGHRWNTPGWPYVQPREEATADLIRVRNGQTSHRRWCRERIGCDWADELVPEIVTDNGALIEAAYRQAEALNTRCPGLGVTWRDVASLPLAEGFSMKLGGAVAGDEQEQAAPGRRDAEDEEEPDA